MAKQTTTTNRGPNTPATDERANAVTPQEVPALADRQAHPNDQYDRDALIERLRAERDEARQEAVRMRHDRDLAFAERDQARSLATTWAERAGAVHPAAPVPHASSSAADPWCKHHEEQLCTCAGKTSRCPYLPLEVDPDADPKPATAENERFNRALAEAKERRAHGLTERRVAEEDTGGENVPGSMMGGSATEE